MKFPQDEMKILQNETNSYDNDISTHEQFNDFMF